MFSFHLFSEVEWSSSPPVRTKAEGGGIGEGCKLLAVLPVVFYEVSFVL